ncbi:MAG: glycosyltransferase family 39 protein, partial [Tepidisphaeraceae bacterium]
MRSYLILIVILLVAASLRIYKLNDKSFWFDEFASVELPCGRGYAHYELPDNVLIAQPPRLIDLDHARPIHTLWYAEQAGHLPPLYVVVMRLWGEAFGLSQSSARAFSVLTSLIAVALMFAVMRELTGGAAPALWAALAMALAGPQIQYAQEARNYMLLLCEALGTALALARIEKHGSTLRRETALVLCVLAMALTHYFAVGTMLALFAYALLRLRGRTRVHTAGCFLVAGLLWGVLGAPLALRHSRNLDDGRSTQFVQDDTPGHAMRTLRRTALLPVRYFTEPMSHSVAPAAIGAVAFVLALLMPLLLRDRRDLLLWGLWLWLTILPIAALDLSRRTQHLEYIRYTLLASPAIYAVAATALANRRGWIRHLPPGVLALACLAALPAAYEAWWKADWRRLAKAIDDHAAPGDVIVFWRGL